MATGKTWTVEGAKLIFENFFTQTTVEDLEIFTFSNNYTPTVTCTGTDLTEITDSGLVKKDMVAASWTVTIDGADIISTFNSGTGIVWDVTADKNIYGIAIRGKTSAKIYYVKNVGLKELLVGNSFTLNPLQLKLTCKIDD